MQKLLGIIALASLLAIGNSGYGQEDSISFLKGQKLSFQVYKTKDENLSINQLIQSQGVFNTLESFNEKTHPDNTYWIRLDFENSLTHLKKDSLLYLKYTAFDFATLFYQKETSIQQKPVGKYNENTLGGKVKANKYFLETSFYTKDLIDGRYLYLKTNRLLFFEPISNWKFSYNHNPIKNIYSWKEFKGFLHIYIFFGICIIMTILSFFFFFYLKRLEFLFNALYIFVLMIYLGKDELLLFTNFGIENEFLKDWIMESQAIIVGICYMLFGIYYLNMKKEYFIAYMVFKISIFVHAIMLFIDVFFYHYGFYLGHIYFLKTFPIIDSLSAFFAFAFLAINNKNRITTFYIIGESIFMFGVGCFFYLNKDSDPLRYYNTYYVILSATIGIIVFAIGLTYKFFIEIVDKMNFQKEAFENKSKALRAQINPHFIFNSLNSIQHLVIKGDKPSALKYLTKFGRLTRNILEKSFEMKTSLEDEIKMLVDYLEMESFRFDNSFKYTITVDEKLNSNAIMVPPMIFQPFVENAIIHGLLPKDSSDKELTINFTKENEIMLCEIEDNGVGRKKKVSDSSIGHKEKTSRGIEVTKQRLDFIQQDIDAFQIQDKVDHDGNPLGTKVIIRIPL